MNIDDIQIKYMTALSAVTADGGWVEWPAVRLALRLAIGEAYAAGAALADDLAAIVASQAKTVGHVSNVTDQRVAESAISQIGRLNEWLVNEEPALSSDNSLDTADAVLAAIRRRDHDLMMAYRDLHGAIGDADALRQRMVQMDADEAGLRRQLVELQREVDRLTRQNVIATDTLNSHLAERTNGAAAVGHSDIVERQFLNNFTMGITPAPAPVDWWQHLDPETNDYRISLDAGRRKFREVPKPNRLLLAQAVARHIGGGNLPKQSEFDTHKPDWMPGGGGLAVTFGCNWSELLTVTPAEVAP